MASTVNRTGDPWNQETKEKFEGCVVVPFYV